ncbi:MAG TPA: ATP synthase F0 subunit C [Myxococcota bacterium]|nr:ATP synthase F0 subunit C [Myxococcota bacterium]
MRKFAKLALWTLAVALLPLTASAADGTGSGGSLGLALGAGLAIGLAGFGCGIGQGLTAGNTTAGIARNPGAAGSMFVNYILGMVLIESIAIYGLVIALLLVFRIT